MARKSKSSENKENIETPEEVEVTGVEEVSGAEATESTEDSPVTIEAEAVDVTESEASNEAEETADGSDEGASKDIPDEDTAEPEPTTVAKTAPAAVASPETSQTGSGVSLLALVFGGIVAGAIGFFGASLAPPPPAPEIDTSALSDGIAANADSLSALAEDVAELRNAPAPEMPELEGQLATITQSIRDLSDGLSAVQSDLAGARDSFETRATELDERILALETAVPTAGDLATGDELAALRERIAAMTADAEEQLAAAQAEAARIARAAEDARLAAEAEAEAARADAEAREAELQAMAERQAALIDLKAAIEAGAPFAELLGPLDSVPDVLAANAGTGVPTIQSLQQGFPEAARVALAQTQAVPEDATAGERFSAFLKRRTAARSLTPQEGDGPDAILSRAEARLGEGNLEAALGEIDALSDEGKAALGAWLDQARTRLSAVEAVDQLSATN